MAINPQVAPYLGRVLDDDGDPVGTCFQVSPGTLVTAAHVLAAIGASAQGAVVSVDPLQGGHARPATVRRADPRHDLAVLEVSEPLPGCVAGLAASGEVAIGAPIVISGVPVLDDPAHSFRHLDADGHWGGGATIGDDLPVGRAVASAVMRGMSGAPVIAGPAMAGGPLVVGIVSARYNSPDGWGRDSVWVARTEDLMPLLAGLSEVAVLRRTGSDVTGLVLSVTETEVRLTGDGIEVSGRPVGMVPELAEAMRGLRAGRARLVGLRAQHLADGPASAIHATPAAVGRLLAESFLPEPVAEALDQVITQAERRWAPVRLGIDVPGALRPLPWEAMALPGGQTPVALHPLLVVYRRQPAGQQTAPAVAGPLRVVMAISAPLSGGSGVLDYERELRNVLAAVRGARQGQARVRIVHFATTSEIYAALAAEPAHVLHLSGHGRPGTIELEDDDGNARLLDGAQFVAEAIPPGRMPAVVALAACHTDAATSTGDPSFAAALVGLGAACVIGTETAVTDVYATKVFSQIYRTLAEAEIPDVIGAVAQARRTVQQLTDSSDRREQWLAPLGEWSVVTVLACASAVPVIDPAAEPMVEAARPLQGRVPAGLLARGTGEFVGRRRAQRRWPAELLAPTGAGLVLFGIGGVGKTTLAAELVRRVCERDPDRLAAVAASSLTGGGTVTVDRVLAAIARVLRRHSGGAHPGLTAAADRAEQIDLEWQDRLSGLREDALDRIPILIVLDNFEDNLAADGVADPPGWRAVADQDLGALLADLATRPGQCRLLITSRYPFVLPGRAERALSFQPIGPLSQAETMKLAWALPALDRLTEPELEQVWRLVGGHPRCLEYVDALLSGGRSSYPDVTARLAANLDGRPDVPDLDEWFAAHGTLDPALAQTLTLAADEVLLDELLAGLATTPGAEDLLIGMSVYRSPVDQAGLLFQVGLPDQSAAIEPGRGQLPAPGLRAPSGLRRIRDACAASSLLAIDADSDPPGLFVHRWTASELERRWNKTGLSGQLVTAHERAA